MYIVSLQPPNSLPLSTCSDPLLPPERPAGLRPSGCLPPPARLHLPHLPGPQPLSCGDDFSWQRILEPFPLQRR